MHSRFALAANARNPPIAILFTRTHVINGAAPSNHDCIVLRTDHCVARVNPDRWQGQMRSEPV